MSILHRITKALGLAVPQSPQPPKPAIVRPQFDLVVCGGCEQKFYRVRGLDPATECIDCQMRGWDTWIANYEARQACDMALLRRIG